MVNVVHKFTTPVQVAVCVVGDELLCPILPSPPYSVWIYRLEFWEDVNRKTDLWLERENKSCITTNHINSVFLPCSSAVLVSG